MIDFITNELKKESIIFTGTTRDGRLNSAFNEKIIIEHLKNICEKHGIKYHKPPVRYWYDFAIFDEKDLMLPINIKISECKTADNISSTKGLYWALTGKEIKRIQWEPFFKSLSENKKDTDADYYFIIINKKTLDIFNTSLKKLCVLVSNGNNMPFQCNWSKNKNKINRTFDESYTFITKAFKKSIDLRSQIKEAYEKHL